MFIVLSAVVFSADVRARDAASHWGVGASSSAFDLESRADTTVLRYAASPRVHGLW
jgi:hypothetical protein